MTEHIDAAIAELRAKHKDFLDERDPILAGFSWSASVVQSVALLRAGKFSRLVLVEGGYEAAQTNASALAKANVVRVLFGAGQTFNDAHAKAAVPVLVRAKIDARSRFAPVGHTFDAPLQRALAEDLEWLVAGDERW
jgi:predicted esterase